MKKYVKPELFYEEFELSQQIADCTFDSKGTNTNETCEFTGKDAFGVVTTIFMAGNTDCLTIAESYCEFASADDMYNLFNS